MMRSALLLALLATAASMAGCANWQELRAKHAPVTESRTARSESAVSAFEQQRDRVQLEAAIDRWQQGDIAGCESRLRSILARRPSDVEAHKVLAELAWSCNDAVEAEAEFRAALAHSPERADLHHALGLVLEATSRQAEAARHFAAAVELEPQNDLYAIAAAAGKVGTGG